MQPVIILFCLSMLRILGESKNDNVTQHLSKMLIEEPGDSGNCSKHFTLYGPNF
jgi:hypothetical protein